MSAARRPELNDESGFAPLVEFLARDVVRPAATRTATEAAHEVDFVAAQLARAADAERVVLASPQQTAQVVARLDEAHDRARSLSAPGAGWQQLLNDGVQDLVADVEHDLQARLRQVLRDTRELIDRSDPRDTWTDTGSWLRRQTAAAGVANQDLLVRRATELTDAVAARFNLESGDAVEVQLDLVSRGVEELELPSASTFSMPGGRLASLIITARTAALVPMVALSLTGVGIPAVLLAGGALVAGSGVGAKLFRDESRRQRSYRQQQAKAAAGKFVEEAAFEMNKQTRDSLRRTQRLLRDEFSSRAQSIQASAAGALLAARSASALDPPAQARRSSQLDDEAVRLGAIRSDMRRVSTAAVTS
jgi:hypothetical protein